MCAIRNCNSTWCENLCINTNLWLSVVTIGTIQSVQLRTLNTTVVLCITWQYSVHVLLLQCENACDTDIACLIIAK